jgi:glycosyltransferase involved in cell wall biosynthesis
MEERLLPPLAGDPLVSVLIVNYNYERYLGTAVDSVLQQTYQRFELIICDDGSTDGSRKVIERYGAVDARIRPIFKENAAVAAALNDAYRASTGEIIALLDADDFFAPTKLARVVERFRASGRVGMILNSLTKIDSSGLEIGRIPQFGGFDRGELREAILHSSGSFSAAPTSGISMRRDCAERVFPIPEQQFRTEADGYMRSIAALYYAVGVIDEPLTIYRVHSSNVTASQTVDLRWAERLISASERIHAAIAARCAAEGWEVAPLENSFGYCEAIAVRDYLQSQPRSVRSANVRRLFAAAGAIRTADRWKTMLKAAVLAIATMMPAVIGQPMLDAVYLPNAAKRLASK